MTQKIISLRFPRTPAGRDILRSVLRTHGLREQYPGAVTLRDTDWDDLARFAAEYFAGMQMREER